ncbi:hypothetical protein CYY_002983 [Polysphondylium violaceum]|uniref:Uncharacterized protein n=1 Tax=Polysphondylium violaceum TaxID=133409 RepID=A0A8J4PYG4_9MYCE|nr:hypothetical protein CYY_002983 [Polysphondylium violaceum]
MQISSNYIDGIINDNARLQQSDFLDNIKQQKDGLSNSELSLLSEIEKRDRTIDELTTESNSRMELLVTLMQTDDQLK